MKNGGRYSDEELGTQKLYGFSEGSSISVLGFEPDQLVRIRDLIERVSEGLQIETRTDRVGPNCITAIVCVSKSPTCGGTELTLIRNFKSGNCPVLACSPNLNSWSIRDRCLPLIAGAVQLLDQSCAGFERHFLSELVPILRASLSKGAEENELRTRMLNFGLVGGSRPMLELFRSALRVSHLTDLPVMITGETGTGKERLARALHYLDPKRSNGPFVPVNCGALSETLAEAELFGHRRGAFTGAERDRKGLVRAADGGVLFLDEVGELSESLQTKLLRVLQERQVLTLGDEREQAVNVRIIAATNRDLAKRVEEGAFRADLLHRLNVLPLHMPPLRERRGDIPALVEYFAREQCTRSNGGDLTVAREVIQALDVIDFPGNVRQLENVIRRAILLKVTPTPLELRDLPVEVWKEVTEQVTPSPASITPSDETVDDLEVQVRTHFRRLIDLVPGGLDQSLDFCERILISLVSERVDGNQSEMARILQVTPRSIYNKLRKHGMARRA